MILIAFLQAVDQIAVARGLQDEMKADLDLHILKHDNYGKGFIKTCKISPDAWILNLGDIRITPASSNEKEGLDGFYICYLQKKPNKP